MSALAEALLDVARQHMGPAASAFVTAELRAVGLGRDRLDAAGLREIAARARGRSSRFMDADGARSFADDVEALMAGDIGGDTDDGDVVDHRLALDAAASLLARGDSRRAFRAYRDLAERHHDAVSLRGLAAAAIAGGELALAIDALRDAAVVLVQQGQRDRAIAVLEEAVSLAPMDLACHRRLAALYANAGDVTSARCEHSRFVEACYRAGDHARARSEIAYARQTVGDAPALRGLEERTLAATVGPPSPVVRSTPPRLVVVPRPEAGSPVPRETTAIRAARPIAGATAEEPALGLIARRDPQAAPCTVTAAQELIGARKLRAAADLLLAYIASGLPGRDVQRLLISVDRELGRPDLADEKCRLLARLLEFDGDASGAVEVRRLAMAS